jgi:O-antigen biosynthesis protein
MKLSTLTFKLNKWVNIAKSEGLFFTAKFFIWKLLRKVFFNWVNKRMYQALIAEQELSYNQKQQIKSQIQLLEYKPLISIIMPVYNVEKKWLEKAIASVSNQLYHNWELCIIDDASTKPHIREVLRKYSVEDSRIKVFFREVSGNISEASNDGLKLASGEFLGLLDHDDELTCDALFEMVKLINKHRDADLIYSDEDKIDDKGKRYEPSFKPNWSPEYLLSNMYVCHFSVYRKSIVEAVGGFRKMYDGAQDFDLCLRVSRITHSIYHISKVLYHWRTIQTSTAANPQSKMYAWEAGRLAVQNHVNYVYGNHEVLFTNYYGIYKIKPSLALNPLISIIIPTAGTESQIRGKKIILWKNCIESILSKSSYKNIEIILIDAHQLKTEQIAYCQQLNIKVIHCSNAKFNFSERINLGVQEANGEYVVLLNDDTEIITADWLEQLFFFASQPTIGAVGARLITESHEIQHAGVVLVNGMPEHLFRGIPAIENGCPSSIVSYKNFLAITAACLMVSKEKFHSIGGFDESFAVDYNDIDFCIRLYKNGFRNVYNNHVELYHFESVSRGKQVDIGFAKQFLKKWENFQIVKHDPFYNPNYIKYPALLR